MQHHGGSFATESKFQSFHHTGDSNVSISGFVTKCWVFFKPEIKLFILRQNKMFTLVSCTPWKCTGVGNSKMSEIKQMRQKVGFAEQASSFGKGRCMPSVSKAKGHVKNTEMQLASAGREFMQPEINWS